MKKLAGLMALLMSLSCFTACDISALLGGLGVGNNSSVEAPTGEVALEVLGAQEAITLQKGESKTYAVNKDISGKDYIKLLVNTNVSLVGQFKYHNVADVNEIVTEDFFIEPSAEDVEFKQFFDNFRINGHGLFDKQLLSISITNVEETEGKIQVKKATVTDRKIDDYERELYVSNKNIKVGADLATGGTLTYLERLNYGGQTIDEVVKDGEVQIGIDMKSKLDEANGDQFLSSQVNLINIYDAGRQFQQSYYANVGGVDADTPAEMRKNGYSNTVLPPDYGKNGYERGFCTTADINGYYWPYNPVQGGDVNSNPSQIIDYEVSEKEIYIKVRAMDWSKGDTGKGYTGTVVGGVTTKSYMENWYSIDANNMVYVRNRFIDWNGFEGLEDVPAHSNELPAAYVVQPLHNYVCYTGDIGEAWDGELTKIPDLGPWNVVAHVNSATSENGDCVEKWFAWVNDDDFGVGVFIPGTDAFASGRSSSRVDIDYKGNKDAYTSPLTNEYRYNKPEAVSPFTSCYVTNTSYTAPVVNWTMKSYVPMEYTYVISVDYVPVMRNNFKKLRTKVTNETLSAWK